MFIRFKIKKFHVFARNSNSWLKRNEIVIFLSESSNVNNSFIFVCDRGHQISRVFHRQRGGPGDWNAGAASPRCMNIRVHIHMLEKFKGRSHEGECM